MMLLNAVKVEENNFSGSVLSMHREVPVTGEKVISP